MEQTLKLGLAASSSGVPDYSAGFGSSRSESSTTSSAKSDASGTASKREVRNQKANEWWQGVKSDPSKITGYLETATNIFGSIFNFVKDAKAQKNQQVAPMAMPTYNQPASSEPKIMGMNKNAFLIGAGILGIATVGTIIYVSTRKKD